MAMLINRLGNYSIEATLGTGSFATVYRARNRITGQVVALKVLHPQLLIDPIFVRRFQAEASLLADLDHPNIIKVYEIDYINGRLFISMQLVTEGTLADLLSRGPLSYDMMLEALRPICNALDYLFHQRIVHQDIKPANILIGDFPKQVFLADFGVARLIDVDTLTGTKSIKVAGTPAYIAPELWSGRPPSQASDIYALGCLVFEMLNGRSLFPANPLAAAVHAHMYGPQWPLDWATPIPEELLEVLEQSLNIEPTQRYKRAMDFWRALKRLQNAPRNTKFIEKEQPPFQNAQQYVAPNSTREEVPASEEYELPDEGSTFWSRLRRNILRNPISFLMILVVFIPFFVTQVLDTPVTPEFSVRTSIASLPYPSPSQQYPSPDMLNATLKTAQQEQQSAEETRETVAQTANALPGWEIRPQIDNHTVTREAGDPLPKGKYVVVPVAVRNSTETAQPVPVDLVYIIINEESYFHLYEPPVIFTDGLFDTSKSFFVGEDIPADGNEYLVAFLFDVPIDTVSVSLITPYRELEILLEDSFPREIPTARDKEPTVNP